MMEQTKPNKIKILRVVTQAEVVPWHLQNFIIRANPDYELYITGNKVTKYQADYPNVIFIDNEIERKISFYNDFTALFRLVRLCKAIKPDIIHSIMPKSGLIAALAGFMVSVPVTMHTYTGQVWSTKKGFSRYFFKLLDQIIYKLNTACLTDSPSQSKFLGDNGFLNHGQEIPYLGKGSLTGVDLNQYDINLVVNRNLLRKELGFESEDFIFGFFARKSISKGIEYLLESFVTIAHLPNTKLFMVGLDESDGRLDELMLKYQNLSQQIINIDKAASHEKYLAICDVLCAPSSSEGFGSIVIEAAALAIPTVGFKVLGLTDSVEDKVTGLLVPYADTASFAAAMKNLYTNKELLEKLRSNAKERVVKFFSADMMYNFQKEYYHKFLIVKKVEL